MENTRKHWKFRLRSVQSRWLCVTLLRVDPLCQAACTGYWVGVLLGSVVQSLRLAELSALDTFLEGYGRPCCSCIFVPASWRSGWALAALLQQRPPTSTEAPSAKQLSDLSVGVTSAEGSPCCRKGSPVWLRWRNSTS